MTKPLSLDLRQRALDAIEAGLSCRAAAARFGIAPSAAVKWRRLRRETGSAAPRALGGDTRSGRIEALGPAILAIVEETSDITPVEIADRLEREHGERFAPSTVHRYFRRHGRAFKKVRPRQRAGPRGRRGGARGLVRDAAGSGPGAADLHRW